MEEITKENIEKILVLAQEYKHRCASLDNSSIFSGQNILNYLDAHETHISHIFSDILNYSIYDLKQNKVRYPILESFVTEFFGEQNIKVDSPFIKAEVGNIDVLIKDKQYVIIIENKINGAPYQDNQPGKYVKKFLCTGGKVLVVLLPDKLGKSEKDYIASKPKWCPSKEEVSLKYSCPEVQLKDASCFARALNRNFSDWLINLLKNAEIIPQKEALLRSNIVILIDYLVNKYGVKVVDEKYEMEKIEILKEVLGYKEYKDLQSVDLYELYESKSKINDLANSLNELNREVDKAYAAALKESVAEIQREAQGLVAEDRKKNNGKETSWVWPVQGDQLHFCVQIGMKSDSVSVNIFCNGKEPMLYIGMYGNKQTIVSLQQEELAKVNKILKDLGLYEMNPKTLSSEHKTFPFSEGSELLGDLLGHLLEIKYTN